MKTTIFARLAVIVTSFGLLASAATADHHGGHGSHANHSLPSVKSSPVVRTNHSSGTTVKPMSGNLGINPAAKINFPNKVSNPAPIKVSKPVVTNLPIKIDPIKVGGPISIGGSHKPQHGNQSPGKLPNKPFPFPVGNHQPGPVKPFPNNSSHDHDHDHHHHHHYCQTPWWLVIAPSRPVAYPYPVSVPVAVPVVVAGAPRMADLVIADLKLMDAGDVATDRGPTFRVTVRNIGRADATKFDLSLYASMEDKPSEQMIAAGMEMDGLAAGSSHTVDFTLHAEALAMKASPESDPAPFNFLFAVADGKNETVESEKRNNVLVQKREDIRQAETR